VKDFSSIILDKFVTDEKEFEKHFGQGKDDEMDLDD